MNIQHSHGIVATDAGGIAKKRVVLTVSNHS